MVGTQTRERSTPRRWWIPVVGVPAMVLVGASLVGCDGWFYYPNAEIHGTPESYDLAVEEVEFAAPGGPRLHGWWVPAKGAAQGTVVYCHGNFANLTLHARFVNWLPARGFNLLVFDYRGFGRSEGEITRAGTVDDAVAAIDVALQRDPKRTVVFGHSLGGAIGIVAAAKRPQVRAIVVESTFPSYRAAARCSSPLLSFLVPLLVSAGEDPITALPKLPPRPLLVIHGTADSITPFELGQALFDAASEPKTFRVVAGGGHVTPWVAEGERFEQALVEFFGAAISR